MGTGKIPDRRFMATTSRLLLIVAMLTVVLAAVAGTLSAAAPAPGAPGAAGAPAPLPADDWANTPLGKDFRGPGFYLSWLKILAAWLIFLLWVYTTDWVSTDCQELNLNFARWNSVVFGSFMLGFVFLWIVPLFWIGFPLLIVAYVAPFATYVVKRNKQVDNDRQVLTREHLRHWLAEQLGKVGIKMAAEKRDPREAGAAVKLSAESGPDAAVGNARLLQARQSPGWNAARQMLSEAFAGRASSLMLDYTQQGVVVRTMVDGVWIAGAEKERERADSALESLKLICGLNPQDRQGRQEGNFVAEHKSVRYGASLTSQGTAGGERVLLQFEDKKVRFYTFDELGLRTKLQEQVMELLATRKGLVLFSALPTGGLRSTVDVALQNCDRFVREFAAVEAEEHPYQTVENAAVTAYKEAEGQSPVDVLPSLFRKEPNVVLVRDLVNAETLGLLCQQIAKNERLIISSIRAKDAAEALLRVMALGVPPAEFAEAITGVVSQRLVRKLCDACKEAFPPTPQMLQQMGIPAGRVQAFYRPPQPNPEQPKEQCQVCGATGYFGRTALFEVLTVGSTVRKALAAGAKLDIMRHAARKDGMKNFQEEGILLVARGITSLPELTRVLKQ